MMKWNLSQGQFLAKSIAQGMMMMMMMNANNNNMMNVAIGVKNLTLLLAKDVKAKSALSWRLSIKTPLRRCQGKRPSTTFVTKLVTNLKVTMIRTIPLIVPKMKSCISHVSLIMEDDHLHKDNDRHLTPMVHNKPIMKMDMSNFANMVEKKIL